MFFRHKKTLGQTISEVPTVLGIYGRQGESLVADLFSLLRSFVPLGAGFVLSVSKRYTHGQRVQREHTVRVSRRNREGLSGQDQGCFFLL